MTIRDALIAIVFLTAASSAWPADISTRVFMNQWGFMPGQQKLAVVSSDHPRTFTVTRLRDNQHIMQGTAIPSGRWAGADMSVALADVSDIHTSGDYRLEIDGADPVIFRIREKPVEAIHDAATKAYYYNRASTALDPAFAGKWHRRAGHPDTKTLALNNPDAPAVERSRGWYDAGDYNKYVVNSGISTYTLLRAYLDNPQFYRNRHWNIPESMSAQPDLLDEIQWNLDWLVTMQDEDGGVYHKLTTKQFSGVLMPEDTTNPRYVTAKSTSATLNFAAVMAVAARVFEPQRDAYLTRARKALAWAQAHPARYYTNEPEVGTGEYGDTHLEDEQAWAAIEYAISTGNRESLHIQSNVLAPLTTPSWASVTGLSYLSLYQDAQELLNQADYERVSTAVITYAEKLVSIMQQHPFRLPVEKADFVWGSNAVMMNKAMLSEAAYVKTLHAPYRKVVLALIDYIGGRNPTGYSFVTGFGSQSPLFIHHRQSQADGVADPVPGWLAGGPQNGHQDNCQYSSNLPATSYLDDECSYSTNEVAINWNAPLVYVLGSVLAN